MTSLKDIHLLLERADFQYIASELVKYYKLKSKIKFGSPGNLADYKPETDTIFLNRSYPSVKEFIITVLHEIHHAKQAYKYGVKKFMKKYTQAGTMATYRGLDPHDDNKWEEKAENWARQEYNRFWKNKF
jgi:hypothetical protein|tara:strand:+ start:2312 stop:2701 length:390 start_codon:yes stop_codon:yes gene_type:complete